MEPQTTNYVKETLYLLRSCPIPFTENCFSCENALNTLITTTKAEEREHAELDGQSQVLNITMGYLQKQGKTVDEVTEYWKYATEKLEELTKIDHHA